MRLSEYAKTKGISYQTALKWHHSGLIEGSRQMPTGTILVEPPVLEEPVRSLIGYARVSSSDQRSDLKRQADRLMAAGAARIVQEVGSGMNGRRKKLLELLRGDEDILVEHRDRLARFGFEYIEASIAPRKIVVLEQKEVEDDLIRDMTEVLTSFCARLYGRRSAASRARRAVECARMESSAN